MNIEVKIEKTAFGGDGIGTVDGKTCFVSGALPGETVIAKVVQDKQNYLKAELVRVVEASPLRIPAPCPHVEACGGCQYQHVAYEEEARIKESQVRETLTRALGIPGYLVQPIRTGSRPFNYRNSVTVHRTAKDEVKPQSMGFVARDNRTRVAVGSCLLVDERLAPVFAAKYRLKKTIEKISFKLAADGRVVSDQDDLFFRVEVGGEPLISSSRGFFQNNLEVTALLTKKIEEWVLECKPEVFYDLFAGVGTFSFLSARSVGRIVCIEESVPSVQALRMNAAERKLPLEVIEGQVEKAFPAIFANSTPADSLVFVDPPRHGLEKPLADFLAAASGVEAMIYVSCDLATLARDLKILTSTGRLRVLEVSPFDMFPKTKHIEIAVLLGT
jgi:23S rRNA (uracil1939-C5)-methyltransferase